VPLGAALLLLRLDPDRLVAGQRHVDGDLSELQRQRVDLLRCPVVPLGVPVVLG
jgi:hypothetical protein